MSITKLNKKIKVLELFNKVKDSECRKELNNLFVERRALNDAMDKKEVICREIKEVDNQLARLDFNDVSSFNLEQKFKYADWLQQQNEFLDEALSFSEKKIFDIENQVKSFLKQSEKISEKIEDTKNELNFMVDSKFMSDNK
jgi:hypothetical protein